MGKLIGKIRYWSKTIGLQLTVLDILRRVNKLKARAGRKKCYWRKADSCV